MGLRPLVTWSGVGSHHNHNCRLWTVPSAACLPQIYQPQSVACLVGSRLVGIDPHPVRGLMVWACICEVSWWWVHTTQSTLLVSNASLYLVEGQRTLVVEHRAYLLIISPPIPLSVSTVHPCRVQAQAIGLFQQ